MKMVFENHYSDIITSAMASQITGVSSICSTVYSGADQRKHQSSTSLAFVRGDRWIPRTKGQSAPHKGPVRRKIFPFDYVILLSNYGGSSGTQTSTTPVHICMAIREYSQFTLLSLSFPSYVMLDDIRSQLLKNNRKVVVSSHFIFIRDISVNTLRPRQHGRNFCRSSNAFSSMKLLNFK